MTHLDSMRTSMKRPFSIVTSILMFVIVHPAMAQQDAGLPPRPSQRIRIDIMPTYQSFETDSLTISEGSMPITFSLPIGFRTGLAVQAAVVNASADNLSSLSGLTDAQVHLSHNRPFRTNLGLNGSVVWSVRVNVPNGTEELTRGEFETLRHLSLNQYNLQIPGLGVGFGITPGVTVALPISESMVMGFGAAYQYRGRYTPIENMIDTYKPGNELLITAGTDIGIGQTWVLAFSGTYTIYQKDLLGDRSFFKAGNKLLANAQMQFTQGFRSGWLSLLYRSRARNALTAPSGTDIEEEFRTLPDQTAVYAGFRTRLGSQFYMSLLGEFKTFGESAILPDVETVIGLGTRLEIPLSSSVQLPLRAMYFAGDLSGYEVSLGLQMSIAR